MESGTVLKIGYYASRDIYYYTKPPKTLMDYLTNKTNFYGQVTLALAHYLVNYSKKFKEYRIRFTLKKSHQLPDGSWDGVVGFVNRSEVDIGFPPLVMKEKSTELVGFAYPFKLTFNTFITPKQEYTPQIFGILKTFQLSTWIFILSSLMAMSFIYRFCFKRQHPLDKVLLHVFGVLLRQGSILRPSFLGENLLIYAWVAGAMFLCLSYESVFFSFLAIPPLTQIKDVSQLAGAVAKGDYHCVADPLYLTYSLLLKSKQEDLKIIARDIQNNNLNFVNVNNDFFYDKLKKKIALIADLRSAEMLSVGRKFVSEDRFLESALAVMIRKDFCCKNKMDTFVLQLMASGLYFKYWSDSIFLLQLPLLVKYREQDTSERPLTLTDVAPAFIFLLTGHSIAFLIFIGEIVLGHRKKMNCRKIKKKYIKEIKKYYH